MKLRDVLELLACCVDVRVNVDDSGNYVGTFTTPKHISLFSDCDVEIIDTDEDGTLVLTVRDDGECYDD